ncbi:tetratricopeptide repeat protein [Actinocrispum sp. NPDC049592]|uniref:tetratricopeptide repeat protein n=1 Tax=Actinocrispum sp. NPDC049592 TaxID=3154835 RepID=UPI0034306CC1
MEFKILGPTRLIVRSRSVPLGAARQRGLLAILLYHANEPVSVQTIGNLLWRGRPPSDIRQILYAPISRIRKIFTDNRVPADLPRLADGYQLDLNPDLIDYHRLVATVRTARISAAEGDHKAVVDLLSRAMEWWTGTPLDELKSAEAEHIREQMVTLWGKLPALHLLFDSQRSLGQHDAILTRVSPLVEDRPHDVELAKHWTAAMVATGRHQELQRHFERLSPRLDEEDDELRAVYEEALGKRHGRKRFADFVPPRQLLLPTREFTGHEPLLAELDAIAAEPGARTGVALTGMPGIGKTTLVTCWAHRRTELFPDGQLYMNVNGYGTDRPMPPDDITAQLLRDLGMPADRVPHAADSRRTRLANLLADRKVLIVLDNVRNADQVRPLLPALSSGMVLITSRDRLKGLSIRDGIRTIAIPPLSHDESVSLLTTLIGARRAAESPATVAALAHLSSGLPLAIRILGQNIAELPEAPLAGLHGHLAELLSRMPEDGQDDETLHTFFSWSYEELPATTARMFRLLGLHPGRSFGVPVANALFNGNAQPHLETLIRRHLLEREANHERYRVHDLLGTYAANLCEMDDSLADRTAAVRRMLDFYLLSGVNAARCLVPQRSQTPGLPEPGDIRPLEFDAEPTALAWCEVERANLAAATESAHDHGFHQHSWQLAGTVHEVYERYGPQADILHSNMVALASTLTLDAAEPQIGTLNNLGATYYKLGNLPKATAYFQRGLELAQQAEHREGQAVCLHNLANILADQGESASAISNYHLALQAYRDIRQPYGMAFSMHRLGVTYHRLDRDDESLDYLTKALDLRVHIGHTRGEGATRTALAEVYLDLGELGMARIHGQIGLTVLRQTMDRVATCAALVVLAQIHFTSRDFEEALRLAHEATEIAAEEIVDRRTRANALDVLARSLQATGDIAGARRVLIEELGVLTDKDSPRETDIRTRLAALDRSTTPPPRRSHAATPNITEGDRRTVY